MKQMFKYYHYVINKAVESRIDKCNAVYTDDLRKDTGLNKEIITMWLKDQGFTKPCNSGKRWVKT